MTRPHAVPFYCLFAPILLVAVIALAWAHFHQAWTWGEWTSPSTLDGDILEIYARVQAASEDLVQPFLGFAHIDRLAAPFAADWSAYPTPDALTFFLAGALARAIGVAGAVNLLALTITVINALALYAVARWLRWRVEWAWTAGLLFAFSSYNFGWSFTLSLNQTFTLPPLILLCSLAARRSPNSLLRRRWCLGAVALGMWIGLSNPYLTFYAALVATAALALAWLRRAPVTRWAPLALTLGSLALVSLLTLLPSLQGDATSDVVAPILDRNLSGTEIYGLKPVGLLIPPANHRWPAWATWGHWYKSSSTLQGEFFQNYLGIFGLAGLLGLAGQTLLRAWISHRRPSDAALGVIGVLLFATTGGGNTLLALAGLDVFRAGARMGVFIQIWALLFSLTWLHRATLRPPRAVSVVLAGLVALIGWLDLAPIVQHDHARSATAPVLANHHLLSQHLAHAFDPGARVFQLPAIPFPEAGPRLGVGDYEHFRPFLTGDSLRYTYGMLRGSRAWVWHEAISKLTPSRMVARLEHAGFAALWIDQRGYSDGAQALLERLKTLGYTDRFQVPQLPIVVVRIKPAASVIPANPRDPAIYPAWYPGEAPALNPPGAQLRILGGWYPLEQDRDRRWRWAGRRSRLGIHLFDDAPASLSLSFAVASLRPGTLQIWHAEKLLWSAAISPEAQTHRIDLPRQRPLRNLHWVFEGPVVSPPGRDRRRLGFQVENLKLVLSEK